MSRYHTCILPSPMLVGPRNRSPRIYLLKPPTSCSPNSCPFRGHHHSSIDSFNIFLTGLPVSHPFFCPLQSITTKGIFLKLSSRVICLPICWVFVVLKLKSLLWLRFGYDPLTYDLTTLVTVMPLFLLSLKMPSYLWWQQKTEQLRQPSIRFAKANLQKPPSLRQGSFPWGDGNKTCS